MGQFIHGRKTNLQGSSRKGRVNVLGQNFFIMPPKELWEAYSIRTVRPSVLLIWIWGPF